MKRPMFIPVSICDPRDFAAMASLPTPPECNARKHSYDFLRNSDAFMLGGISSTKRRRMLSVDMMSSEAPASPPASNAGDDELELSDADSSASSYMARRRSLFQMRNVRHLTPTSPSMPEIFCFAPPTHEEYDYHPELDHSDDEDEEEEEEDDEDDRFENTRMMEPSMVSSYVRDVVASGLFVVEDEVLGDHISYMSDDNYSSSDDEGEVGYHSEDEMHVDDAMSSSDESDSDLSDVDEYQFPVRYGFFFSSLAGAVLFCLFVGCDICALGRKSVCAFPCVHSTSLCGLILACIHIADYYPRMCFLTTKNIAHLSITQTSRHMARS